MPNPCVLRGLLAVACFCLSAPLLAAIDLLPILSGLSTPIFASHAGDGTKRLFIVEQPGVIKVLQSGSAAPTVFLDIQGRVMDGGERGLLGLAFHPSYETNGRFFVYYTRDPDGTIVVAEYHASPASSNVASTNEIPLFMITHPASNHNGGMLAFGPDGYLYIGVGDGGGANDVDNNAQNVNTLLGKILRIDVNSQGTPYTSPSTNPYYGAIPGRDEIFSIGWRNPWRFSFDRQTGQQWVADVGQGAREEVDTPILNGGNHGWRVYEGFACTGLDPTLCNPANYIFPLFDYGHSGGRCSITGGYVYRGEGGTLPSGTYLYGDYCTGEILQWNGSTQTLLLDTSMNISSFGEDEQGELYVVNLGGTLSKIVQTPTTSGMFQGLWWNPQESGWGINFAHQRDLIFATWLTYDGQGKPWWLIAELHKTDAAVYSGPISTVAGPLFNSVPFGPTPVETGVGTMTASFTGAKHATLAYTVNGASQTKEIVPQEFGTYPTCAWGGQPDLSLATNYTDLWWNAYESGWGINFTHQGDIIFATWFTYDGSGKPRWLIAVLTKTAEGVYTGDIRTVTGPPFDSVPWDTSIVVEMVVGKMTITFTSGNDGTIKYTVNGITQTKPITRQVFAPPGTTCQ